MLLTGKDLKKNLEEGVWNSNTDVDDLKFGPNSVDVRLNRFFYKAKKAIDIDGPIDMTKEDFDSSILFEELLETDELILEPGVLYLASVKESFDCDKSVMK